MINNKRRIQRSRNASQEIEEAQREKHRLMRERAAITDRHQEEEGHRRQKRTNSERQIINELKPQFDRLMNDSQEYEPRREKPRQLPNLELNMNVINELDSGMGKPPTRTQYSSQLYKLKSLVDNIVDASTQPIKSSKQQKPIEQHQKHQRQLKPNYSSIALGIKARPCRQDLESLDDIESKVTSEILTLRREKVQLLRKLNQQTLRLNIANQEIQKLQREHHRKPERRNIEDSDKETIINKLRPNDDLRMGRHNVREKIEEEVRRVLDDDEPQKDRRIHTLQGQLAQANSQLKDAETYVGRMEQEIQALKSRRVDEKMMNAMQQHIQRLEKQVESAHIVNQEIRSNYNNSLIEMKRNFQGQLEQLKEQNQILRLETIELLKQPDKAYIYQQEIIKLKAQMERENEAKEMFGKEVDKFKIEHTMLHEQNTKLRKRLAELESKSDRRMF